MVTILVGPIIGHVTNNSAIILFELDSDVEGLLCQLQAVDEEDSGIGFLQKSDFQAKHPNVLKFEQLIPNKSYQIRLPTISEDVLGVVTTMPVKIEKMNVAVVSCDNISYQPEHDMWQEMWHGLESKRDEINILLHIGDNVYLDGGTSKNLSDAEIVDEDVTDIFYPNNVDQSTPYVQARRTLHNIEKSAWSTKKEEILEIYRDEYRRTFSRKYIRLVMAHVSNLMILDDHDIRDDYGSVPEDSDPDSMEFFLGSLALRVFHEYQRALWDPEILQKDRPSIGSEFMALKFGPVGIAMMDSRTVWGNNKVFRDEGDESYFGKQQIQELKNNLYGNSEVRMWILATTMPLIFLKKNLNKFFYAVKKTADDNLAFMNVKHEKDLQDLLLLIREWKEGNPDREIIVFSGDVHVAGFTDIFYCNTSRGESELVCRQITTSAINNDHPSIYNEFLLSPLLHFTDTYGDFTYKHYDWVSDCNYARLCFDNSKKSISYGVKLVHGKKIIEKHSKDEDWNTSKTCPCCRLL